MIEKLEKRLKKIDEISPRGISVLQWVMFAVVAAFCFLFFCHQDVLITAGHAGEYLKGILRIFILPVWIQTGFTVQIICLPHL